jgi:hypothetical protein
MFQSRWCSVSNSFKSEFLTNCEYTLINELSQPETQTCSRINDKDFIIDLFEFLKLFLYSNQTVKIAHDSFKNLIRSFLFRGLDIEKIMCLSILIKFCQFEEIRTELLCDKKLIEYLKSLKRENEIAGDMVFFKLRLNNVIDELFLLIELNNVFGK